MLWARMLAYITGTVDQELLLTNEYLACASPKIKSASETNDIRGGHVACYMGDIQSWRSFCAGHGGKGEQGSNVAPFGYILDGAARFVDLPTDTT